MKILILSLFAFAFAAGAQAQVFRCGNTYTNEPCKGGKEVDVSPTIADPRGAKNQEIYLCRSNQSNFYWSSRTCASQGWMVERIALVPRDAAWDDKVAIARGQRDRAHANTVEQTRNYGSAAPVVSGQAECQMLEERIKWLDTQCRSACGMQKLDWVRNERREARDKQFRLRCR